MLSTAERQVVVVPGLNHVLWAACRDNQTAAETAIGGIHRGVFSYCFFKALRRAGLGVTRRQLDALRCAAIQRMGFNRVPQLEGTLADVMLQPILREVAASV